ncbi:unnamed protein product [Brassica oleracea var. botrytis]
MFEGREFSDFFNTHRGGPHDLCHPTIKRITIHRSETHNFNTPNLLYLDYSDILTTSLYSSANFLDSLLEARLDLFSCDGLLRLNLGNSLVVYAVFKSFTSLLTLSS